MTRAIAPRELPRGAARWRRSLRVGSMFHAHVLGRPVCGANVNLSRHASRAADNLGDMQYWGLCPRCFAKAQRDPEPQENN